VSAAQRLTLRGAGVRIPSIPLLADTARFRPTDPDPLVNASLACPVCLRSEDIEWDDSLEGYDPSVECVCPSCQAQWRVYLAPEQALRVGLMHEHVA
jgi:hypothetical protein